PVRLRKRREEIRNAHELARKDEPAELDVLRELRPHFLLVRVEDREPALGARLHEAVDAHLRGRGGDLLRALLLEARPALQEEPRGDHAGRASRKSRKKLAVVARATSSSVVPRSRASSSATCSTHAGWFGLPRCGTGAR